MPNGSQDVGYGSLPGFNIMAIEGEAQNHLGRCSENLFENSGREAAF